MSILLSVNPPYAGELVDGTKTIEWRKGALPTGTAFIYETKNKGGSGLVIVEVEILGYAKIPLNISIPVSYIIRGRVDSEYLLRYAGGKPLYANLVIKPVRYKELRPLFDYRKKSFPTGLRYEDDTIARPPQLWCYVEDER